jgi:hypothetical protein
LPALQFLSDPQEDVAIQGSEGVSQMGNVRCSIL